MFGRLRGRIVYRALASRPAIRSTKPSASHVRLRGDSLIRRRIPAASSSAIALVTAGLVLLIAATATGTVMKGRDGRTSIIVHAAESERGLECTRNFSRQLACSSLA